MPKNGGVLVVPRSHGTRSGRSHRTRWSSVLHGGRQCCLKEPRSERKTTPARGSNTPDETFSTPARGSNTPDETFSAPARHGSGHHEIFIAHTHPKCPISDHFQRAGAIFLSQRHPTQPHGATQGRSFFHATPREHPQRGGHPRIRAHLETQSLTAVPVGGGRARPQKSRMQFDWMKIQ